MGPMGAVTVTPSGRVTPFENVYGFITFRNITTNMRTILEWGHLSLEDDDETTL